MVQIRVRKKSFGHFLLIVEAVFGIPAILVDLVSVPLADWPTTLLLLVPLTTGSLFSVAAIGYAVLRLIVRNQEKREHID